MKQVININFHGQIVPIEVSAFDILKKYTESLSRYFANEDGKEEIINDIESRIAELFQERLKKGSICITDDDVQAIIKSMGRPEDFDDAEEIASSVTEPSAKKSSASENTNIPPTHKRLYRNENKKILGGVSSGIANYFGIDPLIVRILFVVLAIAGGTGIVAYLILWLAVPSSSINEIGGVRKKLFRDTDDKFVAGVCSGIGSYFGISAWVPRVFFLLPFLSFAFHLGHWGFMEFPDFINFSFSPGALIVYIILWLVIPEATTTAEKLEMKGEKVDMNSIKNSVMGEMKDEKGTEKNGVTKKSGRSLGDVIIFIVKAFAYFVIGCVGFGLVVGLFLLALGTAGVFPLKDYLLKDGWQNITAWGTLIFFIAVPVIGVITWIIRRLAKAKGNSKMVRVSFISLWIVGWVSIICLIASVSMDFKTMNDISEHEIVLSNPSVNSLEFTGPNEMIAKNSRNRWLKFTLFSGITDEDTVYINNVHFRILRSANDSFHVTLTKHAYGLTRQIADSTAYAIEYDPIQKDSMVEMPIGLPISTKNKFRNQHVVVNVYVPVGKKIKINQKIWSSDETSNPGRITIGFDDDRNWDEQWGDEERGWTTDVQYIMKADGLYTMDGIPAKERKNTKQNIKIDDNGIEINNGGKKIKIDENGININNEDAEDIKQRRLDSLEEKQNKEKDSLNRILEQKQQKEKEKILKESPSAYTSPIGLPIINSLM